jgi:SAM-dependent methyltransferase
MSASSDAPWYETFFTGVPLDLWQKAVPPEVTTAEVDFLERELGLQRGQRVLDLPCGAGRHSVELARRGYVVTGIDISAENIERARAAAASAGVSVNFQQGDMRNVPGGLQVDAAFCFGNSFGYLEDADTEKFVASLARIVRPGGRLAIDTGMAAESYFPHFHEDRHSWHLVEDIYLLLDQHYNVDTSRAEITYTHIRDGVVDSRRGSQRIYALAELKTLLWAAGLHTMATYSTLDGAAYEFGCHRLLLVAERLV